MNKPNVAPTVAVLICGMFLAILNQTMVNVAIPHMMNDLNVSTTTIQWLSTGFMLANAIMIPISTFLMATIPTKWLFAVSMLLFTAGSFVCGVGPSFAIVLFGRIMQAIGAGIMMPLVTNIFLRIFPPEKMGKAMGMMGIAMVFAPAVGPTFAGYMVEHFSWRILFFIMVPLGLAEVIFTLRYLSNILPLTRPKLDWIGAILSTVGLGALLYGLSESGSRTWHDAVVVMAIIIGVVFLFFFVFHQLTTDVPLLSLKVFGNITFTMSTLVSVIVNMAMFGAMLLLPIYVQNIRGYTPLESGLLLLPGAILMGIMSPISGTLFDKVGVRPLAIIGLTITALTTYQFTKLTDTTTYTHIMMLYALRSFGMSFIMMTIMTEGLNALSPALKSHGTAVSNTMRQVGSSFGTALLVTVMSTRSTAHATMYSTNVSLNHPIVAENVSQFQSVVTSALGLPADIGGAYAVTILGGLITRDSTIGGINDAFVVATYITVIGLFCSLFLNRPKNSPHRARAKS